MLTSDLFGNNQTQYKQSVAEGLMGNSDSPVAQAIIRRILMQRTDLLAKYGPSYVGQAVDDVADSVGDWDEIGSSDVSGWVRQVEHNLKNKLNQYDEPMNVGDTLDEQAVAEGEKSPMAKDAQRADRIRSLKNLISIAREQGRQLRVQELELELKKLQGVTEMDKSSPQPGRDGRVSHSTYGSRDKGGSKGTERAARPITAKKAAQHALDILKKQGVAEGSDSDVAHLEQLIRDALYNGDDYTAKQYAKAAPTPETKKYLLNIIKQEMYGTGPGQGGVMEEQDVTEGSEQIYNILALDKGNALKKPTKLKWKASSLEDIFDALAAQDWYPLEINGVEVIAGKRLKQSVAEGVGKIGSAIKSLYQKIYRAGDDEIEYFYNASPIFAQYWDEYEGDLDSIIAEVDPEELAVIKAELESYAQDANLAEGNPGYDKHSFIGKIRRSREADNKGWGQLGKLFQADNEKDAEKALRKGNRYYNMTRGDNKTPGGFPKTTVEAAEDNQVNEISDQGLQNYRRQAHYAIQGHKFGSMKDAPNAAAIIAKREKGMQQASDKIVARKKAEDDKRLAVLVAKLPELKAEYEQMQAKYKSLGGSNWQYADREQNLSASEREARSMEGPMNNLWRQIQAAEKAQGTVQEGLAEGAETEATLAKIAAAGDAGYEMIYDGLNGLLGGEVQIILQDMYDDVSRENRLHPDDDYDQIIDGMMDHIESDYGLAEEWSEKYKSSINCSNPKGFSQKAHCAGRNKNESEELTEQDLEEAVGTLELADFLFKGLEQKFPKIIQRYGHEVVGNAIMDVAEENRDVSSVSEVDMLIDDIIEKLQNYNSDATNLSEAKVSRLYYNVVGTSERELRKEFGMRHDRRGWFLSESSGRNRIMDAQRAFGSPKLVEYDLAAGNGSAATLGPDNVISPIGTVPKGQRINTKKSRK